MNTSKYITEEPWLFVDITEPTRKEADSFFEDSNEIISSNSENAPKVFNKAKILHTFDEEKYPTDSEWVIGDAPAMVINYFGKKFLAIQRRNLYARIQ